MKLKLNEIQPKESENASTGQQIFCDGVLVGVTVVLFGYVIPYHLRNPPRLFSKQEREEFRKMLDTLEKGRLPDENDFAEQIEHSPPLEKAFAWMDYAGNHHLYGNQGRYTHSNYPTSYERDALDELKQAQAGVREYETLLQHKYSNLYSLLQANHPSELSSTQPSSASEMVSSSESSPVAASPTKPVP